MVFREWLAGEMQRQNVSRREVARRLAAQHPKGVTTETVETYRRAVRRYLDPESPMRPTDSTRIAFAEAFGVDPDEVPSTEDEEEDLMAPLMRELRRLQERIDSLETRREVTA